MKYVYRPKHPKASKHGFVAVTDLDDYQEESLAVNAPIMAGRFYENTSATDGADIGSRRKHREYMKSKGLAMASDFTNEWKAAERTREGIRSAEYGRRERREAVERAAARIFNR